MYNNKSFYELSKEFVMKIIGKFDQNIKVRNKKKNLLEHGSRKNSRLFCKKQLL